MPQNSTYVNREVKYNSFCKIIKNYSELKSMFYSVTSGIFLKIYRFIILNRKKSEAKYYFSNPKVILLTIEKISRKLLLSYDP